MKKYFVAFLAISIFLFACEKRESNIGLELQPEDENLGLAYDSSTVLMKTVLHDSLSTTNLTTSLLGEFDDPILGKTRSIIYLQPRLNNSDVNFGDGAVLDSLVLSMAYNGEHYGEIDDVNLTVFPLSETFSPDSIYYEYSQVAYDNDSVLVDSNVIYTIAPEDKVVVGGDSLDPHLRINLGTAAWPLGDELLDSQNEANLNDNTAFTEYLKGFRIEAKNAGMGTGGLYGFDLFSDLSNMTIYYHVTGGEDSLTYDFPITVTSPKYVEFQHEYSLDVMDQLDNELDPMTQLYASVYVQAGLGLGLEVNFPDLFELTDTQNIVVNHASLHLPVDMMQAELYEPNSRLKGIMFVDGEQQDIPDALLGSDDEFTNGFYDEDDQLYKLTVTSFVQQVLNSQIEDPTFVVIPELTRTVATRAIINSPSSSSDSKAKLIINYTIF